jgi:phosphoribosyl 1,2-cyclic phosphate phosphodiesterase
MVLELAVLGSAAAEGWPALFCDCDVCHEARRRGGRDIRRRTSYRLGEHIAIDWGPDTYAANVALGLDMSVLTDLVVTHRHEDHFVPHELWYRRPGFSQVRPEGLTVSGSANVIEAVSELVAPGNVLGLRAQTMEPYGEYGLAEGVKVAALPAQHAEHDGGCLNFVFTVDGRELLIGHDTGWWAEDVWDAMGQFSLDVAVIDCTYGKRPQRSGHLGAEAVVDMKRELVSRGCLKPTCRVIANHFSHNGGWLYAELEAYLGPHGIEVGYDGMVVSL